MVYQHTILGQDMEGCEKLRGIWWGRQQEDSDQAISAINGLSLIGLQAT